VPFSSPRADQYFARYAQPEAALARAVRERYLTALVVPACRERVALLDGYEAALRNASSRVLVLLVVNGWEDADDATHEANQQMLSELAARFPHAELLTAPGCEVRALLGRGAHYDVLWLDRASLGQRIPRKEGVGLARKIGADLAALLWVEGQLELPFVPNTDGDATLPADYFTRLAACAVDPGCRACSALLFDFEHVPGGDRAIDEATTLYEIFLRYYVLGLAWAKSPYAYHSIGSTFAFHVDAYLSVRGFARRAAGEDFYLLEKLVKVLPVMAARGEPLRLAARRSDRVPFGTGQRTAQIAGQPAGTFALYAPRIFELLSAVIAGLDAFGLSGELGHFDELLLQRTGADHALTRSALSTLGVAAALTSAAREAPPGPVLQRRVHTWFDGLRGLRFVHLLQAGLPDLPWREALASARFLDFPLEGVSDPAEIARALARMERAYPPRVGPGLR